MLAEIGLLAMSGRDGLYGNREVIGLKEGWGGIIGEFVMVYGGGIGILTGGEIIREEKMR